VVAVSITLHDTPVVSRPIIDAMSIFNEYFRAAAKTITELAIVSAALAALLAGLTAVVVALEALIASLTALLPL